MNETVSFRNKSTMVIIKLGKMIRRWTHPSTVKNDLPTNDSPTVTPSRSRYTLTPHEQKNGQDKSSKVREKTQRRENPAIPAVSNVSTQGVKPQATISTTTNGHVPYLNKNQPEAVVTGFSNTGERYFESQQKPLRLIETQSINQAIAAGVPVIITKNEAERQRVMRAIYQENEDITKGSAAKASQPAKGKERQTNGYKGKGKAKPIKGDKGKGKAKQTQQDRRGG